MTPIIVRTLYYLAPTVAPGFLPSRAFVHVCITRYSKQETILKISTANKTASFLAAAEEERYHL